MNDIRPAMPPTPRNPVREWWTQHVVATVDHRDVVERVQADGGFDAHYAFMILMSGGIAVLGLLLSSPAVVIGAMLISPLMGPIVALGFAIATFDSVEIRRSANALGLGILVAVAFCALIVLLSPLQTVTDEIAARTRPNLFDLLVALFSGLAGSYAMIRGRQGAIVGVAIATSLMPPLGTVGFGLATANGTVFFGASLLFFTNFMVIALAAAIMARLYGFGHRLSPRQTRLQATLIVVTFLALAVPLGLSLRQIAWETLASRQSSDFITDQFGPEARMSQIDIDFDAEPLAIEATVLTPRMLPDAERRATAELSRLFDRPVRVAIDQFRVGTEAGEAEASQIAAARGGGIRATRVAERLALVAGVATDQVLVDTARTVATVRAAALPGADMASYRALEARVAAAEPRWTVRLVPPPAALPPVSFDGDAPDAEGREAIATAIWGVRRLALPIGVGGSEADAEIVLTALREAGVTAERVPGSGGEVALEWLAPATE